MVLIDTSVWVRFIAKREPFFSEATDIILSEEVAAHELIYGELLMGDVGGGRKRFLEDYGQVPILPCVPHEEVVYLVCARRVHGRGAGWIDAHLLASAIAARAQFWTADTRLAAIADELGIAYRPR
jgi:predicted nucleic acid-binding protein